MGHWWHWRCCGGQEHENICIESVVAKGQILPPKKDQAPAPGGGTRLTYLVFTATSIWDPYGTSMPKTAR